WLGWDGLRLVSHAIVVKSKDTSAP
ncbi:hypothetical protein A2U01_0034972, partial [Trifolium medium]|nr:hypothetical protein [Trifolium medium]